MDDYVPPTGAVIFVIAIIVVVIVVCAFVGAKAWDWIAGRSM